MAFALTVAARPRLALAAMGIEGDWVGEDDKRRAVRLTILAGKVVFFAATSENRPGGQERAAVRTRRAKFSGDGQGVDIIFDATSRGRP